MIINGYYSMVSIMQELAKVITFYLSMTYIYKLLLYVLFYYCVHYYYILFITIVVIIISSSIIRSSIDLLINI